MKHLSIIWIFLINFLLGIVSLTAHHTLGVNQTGKATESPQIPGNEELQINDYLINVTVLPGHPAPEQITRIVSYTKNLKTNQVFLGEMKFQVSAKTWFGKQKPILTKVQFPIEGRHIQLVEFSEEGVYEIQLSFNDHEKDYKVHFELLVGQPISLWKYSLGIALVIGLWWILWRDRQSRKRLRPV